MSRHELFLGGGRSSNPDTAIFPSTMPTGDATASAHKEAALFSLTRDMDFVESASLRKYLADNAVANADLLGAILMPKNYLFLGVRFDVVNAVAGLDVDVVLTADGGTVTLFNNISCAAAGSYFANANGELMTADTAQAMKAIFLAENSTIDILVNAQPATGLTLARLRISPVVLDFVNGRF